MAESVFWSSDPNEPAYRMFAGRKMYLSSGWCDSCEVYVDDLFPKYPESLYAFEGPAEMLCSSCEIEFHRAATRQDDRRKRTCVEQPTV